MIDHRAELGGGDRCAPRISASLWAVAHGAWYGGSVVRLFLAVWLAAFSVQSTELLASVIPDDCVEDTRGSAADPCSDDCARCVCCACVPVFVPHVSASTPADTPVVAEPVAPIDPSTSPLVRGILHVPKPL